MLYPNLSGISKLARLCPEHKLWSLPARGGAKGEWEVLSELSWDAVFGVKWQVRVGEQDDHLEI
jgi:hypothetical protein